MEPENSSQTANFSFKIKKLDLKVQRTKQENVNKTKWDYVTSVENKKIKDSRPKKEKKKELVIPLIKNNNWKLPDKIQSSSNLDDLAMKEIMDESARANEDWENREKKEDKIIPLLMQNKIPDGFEMENKMDVSLRPNTSTLEDYERIPVEEYGYAIIKGMGWKPGCPIGDRNKKTIKPYEATIRPKGLGLGTGQNSTNKKHHEEESLILKAGSYVYIEKGQYSGLYGQVEGLDDDNGRVFIKLTKDDEKITLSELFIKVVTEKEYNKEKRIINKKKYEEHKNKLLEESSRNSKKEYRQKDMEYDEMLHERKSDKSRERYTEEKFRKKYSEEKSRKRKYREEEIIDKEEPFQSWIVPLLRVRFVDQDYKNGKYFNTKELCLDRV